MLEIADQARYQEELDCSYFGQRQTLHHVAPMESLCALDVAWALERSDRPDQVLVKFSHRPSNGDQGCPTAPTPNWLLNSWFHKNGASNQGLQRMDGLQLLPPALLDQLADQQETTQLNLRRGPERYLKFTSLSRADCQQLRRQVTHGFLPVHCQAQLSVQFNCFDKASGHYFILVTPGDDNITDGWRLYQGQDSSFLSMRRLAITEVRTSCHDPSTPTGVAFCSPLSPWGKDRLVTLDLQHRTLQDKQSGALIHLDHGLPGGATMVEALVSAPFFHP